MACGNAFSRKINVISHRALGQTLDCKQGFRMIPCLPVFAVGNGYSPRSREGPTRRNWRSSSPGPGVLSKKARHTGETSGFCRHDALFATFFPVSSVAKEDNHVISKPRGIRRVSRDKQF